MPTSKEQVFTLEAVNAMVPQLEALVRRQLSRRSEIEKQLRILSERTGDVPEEISITEADATDVVHMKRTLIRRIAEYQAGWREVEGMGAVLKDAGTGLLDFYGQLDGKLVWLCWKCGEPEVAYYHALDEGFSGRKPIGHSARVRLLN